MQRIDLIFRAIEVLIAIFLATMIGLVFLNVVLRYFFDSGFTWSEEIARLCFIYLVYLGAIGAMRDNQHLIIESVLTRLSEPIQKLMYLIVQGLIIWVMVVLVMGSWQLVVQNFEDRWVATQIPVYLIFGIGLVTGISIIALALVNIYRLLFLKLTVADLISIRHGPSSSESSNPIQ